MQPRLIGTVNGSSQKLDPAQIEVSAQWHTLLNLGMNLVRYDESAALVGDGAIGWTINPEATVFEFQLRVPVKDSGGQLLTSKDWKATFLHLLNKKGSTHSFIKEYLDPDGIQTPSPEVLRLVLKKTYRTLLQRLATPEFILLPQRAIAKNGNVDLKISSGPYYVAKLDSTEGKTLLAANPHHYEYSPDQPQEILIERPPKTSSEAIEQLVSGAWQFMILVNPPTDKTSGLVENAIAQKKMALVKSNISGLGFVLLRPSGKFKNRSDRLALAQKIKDATGDLKNATSVPANQIFPPAFDGHMAAPQETAAWQEIQALARKGEVPQQLTGVASPAVHSFAVPEWLRLTLAKSGIKLSVTTMSHDEYIQKHKTLDHDLAVILTGMNSKDPAGSLLTLLGSKSGVIPDDSGDLNQALEQASQAEGPARTERLQWLARELIRRGLVVPLFHYASAVATAPNIQAPTTGKFNYELRFNKLRWTTK